MWTDSRSSTTRAVVAAPEHEGVPNQPTSNGTDLLEQAAPWLGADGSSRSVLPTHAGANATASENPVVHASGDAVTQTDEHGTLAADAGIGQFDTVALRDSMALALPFADELGFAIYAHLFAERPELRELFPAGMAVQRSRLIGALLHIVGNIDNSTELVPYLKALGRDHRKFGVITGHYASLGSAFILGFRDVLGSQWTERHERAWIDAYDAVATMMIAGADEDAVISPPWWDGEVVFHRRVLHDVAVLQVRPHTTYPYRPGQYCSLMTPRRPRMWRPYSLASAPRDDGLLEFHVRAVGAGWVSSSLVWRTEPGDFLRLGAAQGKDLASPRSERDLLCICAGTGVAPVLAAMQELEARQDGRRVHIFYAGQDRERLYALPLLESIGVRYRRLTVVPVVSPEGTQDRSPDVMGNVVSSYGDWRQHDIYVAGQTHMVQSTVDRLRAQGVTDQQITFDDYGIG
ncbi:MAG TPA: globin domain-containing protein [Jiangellaceae bacterium]